jgi:nicotinate dehydrogenase subunit B
MNAHAQLDRRALLIGAGTLTVAFSLKAAAEPAAGAGTLVPPAKTVAATDVDAYLAIDAEGAVTLYSGKVDLGTGLETALTQIVAEELDVAMAQVRVIQGDTALTPDQGTSSGSNSIQKGGLQIRKAAATARHALIAAAAAQLGVDPASLSVEAGIIHAKDGRSLPYGALIGGRHFDLKLDPAVLSKNPDNFTLVGKPVVRLDIPGKCTGSFTYMQDVKVPGMLHGRVVRPPAIGATLQDVDESSIKDIPGLIKIVRIGNFLGIVTKTEWAAIKAARQLEAKWSAWEGLPEQAKLWDHVRTTRVAHEDVTSTVGKGDGALTDGAKRLKATYDFAIHTHGSIGPSCAIVSLEDGQLTCWTASQATHNLVKQLAAMMRMAPEAVRCIYVEGSGCYGRNGHEDAAGDAALLAQAVGAPVRVQWSRHDEHGWDPKGPPTLIDLEASLDAKGDVQAWSSQFYMPQGVVTSVVPLTPAILGALPHSEDLAPGGITGNTAIQYAIPNIRTVAHRLETTPFRPSWIRTPGRMQNTFANESFMDELALAAGVDPFDYRRARLTDKRGLELLDRLQAAAKWERPDAKRDRTGDVLKGRGMAYVKYELVRTYVGGVAEVEIDRKSGKIRCTKFTVAQDCGQIINPDGIRNQLEGNIVQTVSRTLIEELTFDRAMVTSLDWASYPIVTFPDIPEVVMDLIDRPHEPPWGAGEPSAAIVPPAICNAVADALGVRLRSIPFKPEKVKAALGSI